MQPAMEFDPFHETVMKCPERLGGGIVFRIRHTGALRNSAPDKMTALQFAAQKNASPSNFPPNGCWRTCRKCIHAHYHAKFSNTDSCVSSTRHAVTSGRAPSVCATKKDAAVYVASLSDPQGQRGLQFEFCCRQLK
ncbi:unnamed protein product [Ixodes pacificus]